MRRVALFSLVLGLTFMAAPPLWADDEDKAKAGAAGDASKDDEGFGAGRKNDEGDKPERAKGRKGKKEEPKEEPGDDPKKGDDPAGEEKPADGKKAEEDKKGEDGFGAGRADEKKSHKIDEAELATNKDKAKYVKMLRKQFKKEDGFYVLATMERGIEKDMSAAKNDKNAKPTMKPYERLDWMIFDGREEAVGFIVHFMSEFGEPWAKKSGKSARGKKGAAAELDVPKPERNFNIVGRFETAEEAEGVRDAQQQAYAAAQAALEERNKPRQNRNR